MKTILLVDDDYIARNKIRSMIEWEQSGGTVIYEAANGREALEAIRRNMPQIALVDMDMPIMNGVELIREIVRLKYPVSVIVLSSYNDFEYVRESMKLGALDYILKGELNSEQLGKALLAADNSRENEQNENLSMQDKEYLRELYAKRILLRLFEAEEECGQWIVDYRLPLGQSRNMLALCEIDDYSLITEEMDEQGQYQIHQFMEQIFKETAQKAAGTISVKIKENQYCLVLSCDQIHSISEAQQRLHTMLTEIRRNLKRFLNMTVTSSISSIALNLPELSEFYRKAEQRLKGKFYLGGDGMIQEQIVFAESLRQDEEGYLTYRTQILGLLLENDREGAAEKLTQLFGQIREQREQEKRVREILSGILQNLDHLAERKKLDFRSLHEPMEWFRKIQRMETLKGLEKWMQEICTDFCDLMDAGAENHKYNKLTVNAIAFLKQNYKNTISLSETAEYLQVSSSHLSRVFKNDTGTNLVHYLNRIRIDKAKQLLETREGIPVKEVALAVGFQNYNHFFSTFRNIAGMSPNEYREKREI